MYSICFYLSHVFAKDCAFLSFAKAPAFFRKAESVFSSIEERPELVKRDASLIQGFPEDDSRHACFL